jgi:hypothetical protein
MPTATAQPLRIDFESQGFPAGGSVTNGHAVLGTSWDELLWAAVTVGRPNRSYVFRHGDASLYEALFRWSLTRMALEQRGPTAYRLRRTDAARTLDPSEKGAVSYFLGMTFCKLFSERLLDAPWVMHLDVFRPLIDPVLTGRSRPDLVGQQTRSGRWIVLESKGRVSPPNADSKDKAKQQAQRVVTVNGAVPSLRLGCVTYFRNDVLQFYWTDPEPDREAPQGAFEVSADDSLWRHYYLPVFQLIHSHPQYLGKMLDQPVLMPVETVDIEVGIHPLVLKSLVEGQWGDAKNTCAEHLDRLRAERYQPDGLRVVAGETWSTPFVEFD